MNRRRPAFTLIELLVVLVIVLLVSAVTLPSIVGAFSHRQVSEAARILQGALVGARDAAIKANEPRGIRLLPDPTYYGKPGTRILAYNRTVPIEPGPQYSNGLVTIWPAMFASDGSKQPWYYQGPQPGAFPPTYPYGGVYPLNPPGSADNPTAGQCLMIEQAPFQGNDPTQFATAPTSWYWNVRIGDKITLGSSGNTYTVVGPCTINPISGGGNPELFVNVGPPGDPANYLQRRYTAKGGTQAGPVPVEYLLLVNGLDDPQAGGDGYPDNGFDGIDNNQGYVYNGQVDDQGNANVKTEWEVETWRGMLAGQGAVLQPATTYDTTEPSFLAAPTAYTIQRRPVPTQAARETMLPSNVVVDATTWDSTRERSRLPGLDRFSGYCDIMLLPSGQVVPTTVYSSPSSFGLGDTFYHFWLAERQDVHEATELWGTTTNPNSGLSFLLPMPQDAYDAYVAAGNSFNTPPTIPYRGERMLLTLFSRTGNIVTNGVESFNVADVNTPYYEPQLGMREAK